jgi:hypothetical protein
MKQAVVLFVLLMVSVAHANRVEIPIVGPAIPMQKFETPKEPHSNTFPWASRAHDCKFYPTIRMDAIDAARRTCESALKTNGLQACQNVDTCAAGHCFPQQAKYEADCNFFKKYKKCTIANADSPNPAFMSQLSPANYAFKPDDAKYFSDHCHAQVTAESEKVQAQQIKRANTKAKGTAN